MYIYRYVYTKNTWNSILRHGVINHVHTPHTFSQHICMTTEYGSEYGLHVKLQRIWYDNFKENPFLCKLQTIEEYGIGHIT